MTEPADLAADQAAAEAELDAAGAELIRAERAVERARERAAKAIKRGAAAGLGPSGMARMLRHAYTREHVARIRDDASI